MCEKCESECDGREVGRVGKGIREKGKGIANQLTWSRIYPLGAASFRSQFRSSAPVFCYSPFPHFAFLPPDI